MATVTGIIRVYHGTLTAATVDKVDFVTYYAQVEVLNRGSTEIYVSLDAATDPTVGGNEFDVVPANSSARLFVRHPLSQAGTCEVRLISSGTPAYSLAGGE